MKFLLPKDKAFFNYLKNSTHNLENMSAVFEEITKSYKNFASFGTRAEKIEHQADENVHEVVRWLNRAFITPFDREDIYLLVLEFDDVLDLIEEIIHDLDLYRLKNRPFYLVPFCSLVTESSENLIKLLSCLEASKSETIAQSHILKIHELEDKGDALYDKALRKIFCDSKHPLSVIKNKDLCDKLEKLMDKFQKLSDIVEGLLLKYN